MSATRAGTARAVRAALAAGLVALLLAALAVLAWPGPAAADDGSARRPLLGAVLDWGADSAAGHAARLGAPAAVYAKDVPLPLTDQEQAYLRSFFAQASAQGADALLTVSPQRGLDTLGAAEAEAFARAVAAAGDGFAGRVLVSFAPQMNAPWVGWGQQPGVYVEAYRRVAEAVRGEVAGSLMVWAPAAGADYPFRQAGRAAPPGAALAELDTDGDGLFGPGDDPYAPYYPGDDTVDWVGLSLYHDASAGTAAPNTLPGPDAFAHGLGPPEATDDGAGFYGAYAAARGKPLLVETAAYYSRQAGGPGEQEVKAGWWGQVFAAVQSGRYPQLSLVLWNETLERRADGAAVVDWRATAEPQLAADFLSAARGAGVVAGPLHPVSPPGDGLADTGMGTVLTGPAGWAAAALVPGLAALLWILAHRREARRLHYGEDSDRDQRIDLLRGLAIVLVVVNHLALPSLFQLGTQEAIGVVSGAEFFVMLSGTVLGMAYGPMAAQDPGEVIGRMLKRAWKLYVTALAVVLSVWALSLVPGLNSQTVTTFTDQGTGAAGRGAAGRVYDLYSGMDGLLEYPVPPGLVPQVALLQFGPWQVNILGLYVALLLLAPLVLAALARGWTWQVLAASGAVYALAGIFRIRVLPAQFEDAFPLLVWQVLFVLGLVAGYHRARLVAWFAAGGRRPLLALCVAGAAALTVFAWCSPYVSVPQDVRLGILPAAEFSSVYDAFFGRTYLGPGRVLNVLLLLVAGYALLTAFWRPIRAAVGGFLIPLGRATLYVFTVHVFLALAVANIPGLDGGNVLLNTVAYVLILAALWGMVRSRFLFAVIPR